MDGMRYWKTYKKHIIREYIEIFCDSKRPATLWQQMGDDRIQYPIRFKQFSKEEITVEIEDKDFLEENPIREKDPIFIHVPGHDFIFKQERYRTFVRKVFFNQPFEAQIYDQRKNERFYYKYQDHKNITYESVQKVPGGDGEKPLFSSADVLVDISVSGAGFVVSEDLALKLAPGTDIHLVDLTDQKLPTPFHCKVKYVGQYGAPEDNLYKVGVEFADELDSVTYKSITSIIEKKQKRVRGIRPDMYCGLDEEDQIKMLYKVEYSNKQLAINLRNNIEYLDRLRYMTTQMKIEFLQEVNNDLLANALRMSSKELIYDLLTELTDNMQEEFLEKLGREMPASGVCKAQDEIVKFVREKEGTGEYILDPLSFTTYV